MYERLGLQDNRCNIKSTTKASAVQVSRNRLGQERQESIRTKEKAYKRADSVLK